MSAPAVRMKAYAASGGPLADVASSTMAIAIGTTGRRLGLHGSSGEGSGRCSCVSMYINTVGRRVRLRGGRHEAQGRPRALAGHRGRQDGRQPGGPLRAEELRDPVRVAARPVGAPAPDRRPHARLRDHRDAPRPPADRRPRRDLDAAALATTSTGGREERALPESADEDDPLVRAPLPPPPALPVRPSTDERRLRRSGHRRLAGGVPGPAVLRPRPAYAP